MANWESAFCKTNGINIHYTRTGGCKPPIILLHGLMTNGACWTVLARALESEYDVIMPDARGHGKSSVPDYGYRYEDHAEDISGLISALKLSPPVLLGHSMGGMTAAVVASRKPNLLRALILADPTFLSPKIQREVRDSNLADQHRKVLNMPLYEVISKARLRHPGRSSEILDLFARARLQTSIAAFDILMLPSPDYKQIVSNITVPSLLVFGDDGIVSPTVAEELQCINRKFRLKQIRSVGHALHIDKPVDFEQTVKTFLRAMDAATDF